ncbi:MAG: response regulator, partial [Kofleriaceae bacterium]
MRGSIGQLLIQQGVVDASALSDALARQSGRHPVASELYALGYASERQLALALSIQTGWPGIVFDESVIRLDVLEHVSLEWARIFSALVVYEDASTIVIAAARPEDAIVPARELAAARGKNVELRIALDLTLARSIRVGFQRYKDGETYLFGVEAKRQTTYLAVVAPDEDNQDDARSAQRALAEEAARAIEDNEELPSEEIAASATLSGEWQANTITTTTSADDRLVEEATLVIAEELDRGSEVDSTQGGRMRALIVDPDPPGRIQLVSELERLGFECQAVGVGAQAVDLLSNLYFDLVFADVATPELDGLRMCRAIKRSRRLARSRVIVTTSVVDSGQIPDETLKQHGADGYLEKPLDPRRLHRLLRDLNSDERADHEQILADALGRYHQGDI